MDAEGSAAQNAAMHTPDKADDIQKSEGEAMPTEQRKAYGCIFCLTGKERVIAECIQRTCPGVHATAAMQEKHKSTNGKKSRIQAVMLPGYVFFEAPDDVNIILSFPKMDVIRILKEDDHDWRLAGNDYKFAKWLFSYDGCIRFSTAYREGERIRIASGPLKDMEGMISRIDKRGRSGLVTLKFDKRDVKVWLGFELIEKPFSISRRDFSEKESE